MSLKVVAPGLACLPTVFVNTFFVGEADAPWFLVDSGIPGFAGKIEAAAKARFGDRAPVAIFLTHGHFDHAGSARALSETWDVPVFAGALELPYLSGMSNYPPPDPTVGGAIAQMSRAMPRSSIDLGARLQALPEDGAMPGTEGWRWIATPGHSPGHVSFWNEEQRILIAGDAVATADFDSTLGMISMSPKLWRSGTPFNCDWDATRDSARRLAQLRPRVLACGHGTPQSETIAGEDLAQAFARFAADFPMPAHGRYVEEAAQTDAGGVAHLPPAPADPLPKIALGATAIAAALYLANRARK